MQNYIKIHRHNVFLKAFDRNISILRCSLCSLLVIFCLATIALGTDKRSDGKYHLSDWATLQLALDEINSQTAVLVIDRNETLASYSTVNAGISLEFVPGNIITMPSNRYITINGRIIAGPYQIFQDNYVDLYGVRGSPQVDCVFPQWWGGKGDDSTDNFDAIKHAIKTLQTTGGKIYFPAGTYAVSATLVLKKNLTLEGEADHRSIIKATGGTAFTIFVAVDDNASYLTFRNLVIDLNNLSGGSSTSGMAIYIHTDVGQNGADPGLGNSILNCEIKNADSYGIRGYNIIGEENNPFELLIADCKIHDCARDGILIDEGTNVTISKTELYDNTYCGVNFVEGSNHVVEGCNVYDNLSHGIAVGYSSNWKVINNIVINNGAYGGGGGWGIAAGGGVSSLPWNTHFIISGNVSSGNYWGGITIDPRISGDNDVTYPSYAVVANNVCTDAQLYHGINLNYASHVVLTGNVCQNNDSGAGIALTCADKCVVGNNVLDGNLNGISFRTTAAFSANPIGHHEISQNQFDGNTTDLSFLAGYEDYIEEIFLAETEDIAP